MKEICKEQKEKFNLRLIILYIVIFFVAYLGMGQVLNLPAHFNNAVFQNEILPAPIILYFILAGIVCFGFEKIIQNKFLKHVNAFSKHEINAYDKKNIAALRKECMHAPYNFIVFQLLIAIIYFVITMFAYIVFGRFYIANYEKIFISVIRVEMLIISLWLLLSVFQYNIMQSYLNNLLIASYENNKFFVKNDRVVSNSNVILVQIFPILITIFILFANFSYTNMVNNFSKTISSYYNINMANITYKNNESLEELLQDLKDNVVLWEKDNVFFVMDSDGNILTSNNEKINSFMLNYMEKFFFYNKDENGKDVINLTQESNIIYNTFGSDEHAFVKCIKDSIGRRFYIGAKYYAGDTETFKVLCYASIIMLGIYFIIILYWSKSNIVTMKKLENKMKQILSEKDIMKKNFIPILSNDELGNISYYYNKIQEKLVTQADIMFKQEQLSALGELAGGMAHDINTPISSINTSILLLEKKADTDFEKEILDNMKISTERIINIVNSMRNQIRNLGSNEKEKFSLNQMVEDLHILTQNEQKKNSCNFVSEIKEEIQIYGEKTKLGQVLTNIVVNAIQAYGQNSKKGDVKLIAFKKETNICRIEISDEAGGIPAKFQKYLFKNIMTTKGAKGTGLGLYLASSVITGIYKGKIWFEVKEGIGTTFIIEIPIEVEE